MAAIVWQLDLQLYMQSVSITTDDVGSNLDQDEVYSLQHYVIKFVSNLQQVGGFLPVLWFPPPMKLTATITLKYLGYAYNLIRSCWDYVRKTK